MYAVVNHMKLSRPLDSDIIGRMNSELMANIATMPGAVNALCVQVADDGIVVVVICEKLLCPCQGLRGGVLVWR